MRNAQAGSSPAREDNDEDEGNDADDDDDDNVVDEASSFLDRALVTVENKFSCRSIKIPIVDAPSRERREKNNGTDKIHETHKPLSTSHGYVKFETCSHACNLFSV